VNRRNRFGLRKSSFQPIKPKRIIEVVPLNALSSLQCPCVRAPEVKYNLAPCTLRIASCLTRNLLASAESTAAPASYTEHTRTKIKRQSITSLASACRKKPSDARVAHQASFHLSVPNAASETAPHKRA